MAEQPPKRREFVGPIDGATEAELLELGAELFDRLQPSTEADTETTEQPPDDD